MQTSEVLFLSPHVRPKVFNFFLAYLQLSYHKFCITDAVHEKLKEILWAVGVTNINDFLKNELPTGNIILLQKSKYEGLTKENQNLKQKIAKYEHQIDLLTNIEPIVDDEWELAGTMIKDMVEQDQNEDLLTPSTPKQPPPTTSSTSTLKSIDPQDRLPDPELLNLLHPPTPTPTTKKPKVETRPWESYKEDTQYRKIKALHPKILEVCTNDGVPFQEYLKSQVDPVELCTYWGLNKKQVQRNHLINCLQGSSYSKAKKLSPAAGLYWKDVLLLSDLAYFTLRKVWNLQEILPSLESVKAERKKYNYLVDQDLKLDQSITDRWEKGWAVTLDSVIHCICNVLRKYKQKHSILELKISLDGRILAGKQQILVGVIPILRNKSIKGHSSKLVFPLMLVECPENEKNVDKLLDSLKIQLEEVKKNSYSIGDQPVTLDFWLAADLKSLWEILGLKYHSQ
jgi:hypothetical protein